MTDREAMKMALEALETKGEHHKRVYAAIVGLKQDLAQPEPKLECETCARKRDVLIKAGLLKSPLRQALAKHKEQE